MNESHDSHVFCFAYSVHRLIRHALADTHAPCRIPARERSAMLSRELRSISPRLLHRFCRRFRSHERNTDENARDTRINTGRGSENRNDVTSTIL